MEIKQVELWSGEQNLDLHRILEDKPASSVHSSNVEFSGQHWSGPKWCHFKSQSMKTNFTSCPSPVKILFRHLSDNKVWGCLRSSWSVPPINHQSFLKHKWSIVRKRGEQFHFIVLLDHFSVPTAIKHPSVDHQTMAILLQEGFESHSSTFSLSQA